MAQASHKPVLLAAALAASLAWDARAAQMPVGQLGILTCSLERDARNDLAERAKGREALCEFRASNGAVLETYVGLLRFIGQVAPTVAPAETIILIVKAPLATVPAPGVLQQSYAADASTRGDLTTPAGRSVPLLGEKNGTLVLQPEPKGNSEPTLALGRSEARILISAELTLRSSGA
jgi:hypothetical protein